MEYLIVTPGQVIGTETIFDIKVQQSVIQFMDHFYNKAKQYMTYGTERFTLSCESSALPLIEKAVELLKTAGWDVITIQSMDDVRVIVNPTEQERATKIKSECEKLNAYATANGGLN